MKGLHMVARMPRSEQLQFTEPLKRFMTYDMEQSFASPDEAQKSQECMQT
jgi:hypothetical protein